MSEGWIMYIHQAYYKEHTDLAELLKTVNNM